MKFLKAFALAALLCGASDIAGSQVTTSQMDPFVPVACQTTPTLIVPYRQNRTQLVIVQKTGTDQVWFGGPAVAVNAGGWLPATAGAAAALNFTGPLYCIVPTTPQTLTGWELHG